jgi:S-adenosylmethionine:tRNA ribosyltransferase-isomerase
MSFQQPEWLRSGSSTKDKQHEEHGNTAGSSITGDVPREFSLSTYQFDLPQELIAQEPVSKRDESRLLCINRSTGQTAHHTFKDLPLFLHESDLLVLNETKVTPCALTGHKTTGGRVSLLVLDPVLSDQESLSGRAATRVCMAGSSKPLRSGMTIVLENSIELIVEKILVPGRVVIRFPVEETGFLNFLETHGTTPLPPYIKPGDKEQAFHRERYQTVYSRSAGSVAAPTAGLHFTERLFAELDAAGISTTRIVLHVGPGTFMPVRQDDVRLHAMESEIYDISQRAADDLQSALDDGRRIIAVGTTSVRTLESAISPEGRFRQGRGRTDLFIVPGHHFRSVHGMVTNFHLPGSTLLMLVCAFAGTERVLNAYRVAVRGGYRFYSYGDACLIL